MFLVGGNGWYAPLVWQSRKIQLVVKNTISAEAMVLLDATENCYLLKMVLQQLIVDENIDIPIVAYTDCKSLKDAVNSSKTIEDKKLKFNIPTIREYLQRKEITKVRWINTKDKLANSLTKAGASTTRLLNILNGDSSIL